MKKSKTLLQLKAQALDAYSELVKVIAEKEGKLSCYTCDAPLKNHTSNCQLGHYLSRGGYPGLTFHKNNSRLQCFRCNIHLRGNTVEFRVRLIDELGEEEVEALESNRHVPLKLSRTDYIEMIAEFRKQIKELSQ